MVAASFLTRKIFSTTPRVVVYETLKIISFLKGREKQQKFRHGIFGLSLSQRKRKDQWKFEGGITFKESANGIIKIKNAEHFH